MDKYKYKHATPVQRLRMRLKEEVRKEQTFWRKLKVMWMRNSLRIKEENIKKYYIRGGK